MPKLKTHKASKKRMKVTKNGKVLRGKGNKSHLNSSKTGKRIRQLRKNATVHSTLEKKYRMMIDV
jgi:large subunit ribosomal protein L35